MMYRIQSVQDGRAVWLASCRVDGTRLIPTWTDVLSHETTQGYDAETAAVLAEALGGLPVLLGDDATDLARERAADAADEREARADKALDDVRERVGAGEVPETLPAREKPRGRVEDAPTGDEPVEPREPRGGLGAGR
jgi:hypothetical protein